MRSLLVGSPRHASELEPASFPCLLEFKPQRWDDSKESPNLVALETLAEGSPPYRVIVLLGDRTGTRGDYDLLGIDRTRVGVIKLPSEAHKLVGAIVRARLENRTIDLEDEVAVSGHLHPLARASLIWILQRRLGTGRPKEPLRPTRLEIARGIGCSPVALAKIDRSAGLHLEAVADAWAALLIQASHEIEGFSWKHLARAAGYQAGSGVTRLFLRTLDQTPRETAGLGIDLALEKFEQVFYRAIAG
jgi:hypothetical protein